MSTTSMYGERDRDGLFIDIDGLFAAAFDGVALEGDEEEEGAMSKTSVSASEAPLPLFVDELTFFEGLLLFERDEGNIWRMSEAAEVKGLSRLLSTAEAFDATKASSEVEGSW